MLWLTWRQHRSQMLITAGLLVALGAFLLVHGLRTNDLMAQFRADPNVLDEVLGEHFTTVVDSVFTWLPLAPAAIGLFWGAPVLGKEFERGTHRLAWTQSVSVRRWLAVKLGVLATAVTLAGLALGAMINTWLSTFDGTQYSARFHSVGLFVLTGVVPGAWWLFAFMTGVAAGAVFRRTLPAIAATLAIVVTATLSMFLLNVRAYYASAERMETDPSAGSAAIAGDVLIQRTETIDTSTGRVIGTGKLVNPCPPAQPCARPDNIRLVVYYHPADRYWRFQWTETALLLAGTLALSVVAVNRTARSRI